MEKEAPRTVRRLTPALCVLAGLSLLLMLCLLSISSARSTLPQAGLNFGQVEPLAQGWQLLGDNGRWSELASLPRQLETQQGEAVLRVALPHSVPASCGPGPMKKYELQATPVAFSFIMMPLERSYTQSELTKKARVQMPA